MVTDTTDAKERSRDLVSATGGAVREWDEPGILDWLNGSVLGPALDKSLRLEALSDDDPALQELENRKRTERERAGIEMLENLLATIEMLHEQPVTHSEYPAGQIASFEKSVLGFKDAAANEATARSTTSESVFGEVWANAKKIAWERRRVRQVSGVRYGVCQKPKRVTLRRIHQPEPQPSELGGIPDGGSCKEERRDRT